MYANARKASLRSVQRLRASAWQAAQIAALSFVAVAVAACDIAVESEGGLNFGIGAQAKDEWTRSYKVAPGGQLELININGRISAEAVEGDRIEIHGERTAKATSDEAARELLSKTEMREEAGDARVRIEVRPPRMRNVNLEIKWTIKVPKGVAVDLRTVNGGVTLTGLAGDVRARATNGGIKGHGIVATNVDASVTNGGVEIELANAAASGSIELESVNGAVELRLPSESKADVTARCVNGGISVDGLSLELVGEQSRRRLEGKLNGGGGARVNLETTNGGVRISRATT
jgi:hypothetical protein